MSNIDEKEKLMDNDDGVVYVYDDGLAKMCCTKEFMAKKEKKITLEEKNNESVKE